MRGQTDQVADLPPENGNLKFILIDFYSESSCRSTPMETGILKFILIDSYSEI